MRYVENSAENTTESVEMCRFNNALRQIVQIPKVELNRLLDEERRAKAGKLRAGPKPKASVSDRSNAGNRELI
jgi:hypothetical protein